MGSISRPDRAMDRVRPRATPAATLRRRPGKFHRPGREELRVIFRPLPLAGAFEVELEPIADERGFFARSFCRDAFRAQGLAIDYPQCSISFNARRGTLRGMHYQAAPHAEAKLVRCTRGRLHDVIVDLRPESPSYCRWTGVELAGAKRNALYVPEGFAHGFLTLEDETEVFYQISHEYRPEASRGVRFDDPAFGIRWPAAPAVVSERDRAYPDHVR
jgi:dTDP-4-dehydrorhamnose 3,5-epimerase